MSDSSIIPLTELLEAAGRGEREALDGIFPRVYDELKGLAHRVRAGRAGETLDTTALVHEAYLKLAPSAAVRWRNRGHFFAVAARAMRQVLVDAARRDRAARRGGDALCVVTFEEGINAAPVRSDELLALDDALATLASIDPRRARVVEYRIFCGLTTRETAELLNLSTVTVERDWRAARAYLALEMSAVRTDNGEDRP